MAAKPRSAKHSTRAPKSDLSVSYNEFKEFEGQRYTGVTIGRSHKWHYDRGEWQETKITPDLWRIAGSRQESFAASDHRRPPASGAARNS